MAEKGKGEEEGGGSPKESESREDAISKALGDFGKWQLQLIILLSLFNIPCTWHIYAMTFESPPPADFFCSPPPNLASLPSSLWRNKSQPVLHDGRPDPCRTWNADFENATVEEFLLGDFANLDTRDCKRWTYLESEPGETVITQWDLVCGRKDLASAAEMSFLAGVAVGGLVSGMLSDRFGRKKTLMASVLLQIVIGVGVIFVRSLEFFYILRALLGFVSVSVVFSGFVLSVEIVGGKWRTIAGVVYMIPVPVSYISIAGIAYYIRPWKELQLAITLPAVLLLGLWWILPESPRWLLATGRVEDNLEILKEAARINNRPLPPNADKLLQQSANHGDCEKAVIRDLLRHPRLRRVSLFLFIVWFSVYFTYYGLVMNMSNIGGDIYVNTVIAGAVEIPSMAFSIFILLKMGRRWPLSGTIFASGVACLLTLPTGDRVESVTITFVMIGKFLIACSNAIMPIFTAELYPTVVRNLGVGVCNVFAGMALVLVPYIWNLAAINSRLPMVALGATGVVGGLSVLFLEETANRPLRETLKD